MKISIVGWYGENNLGDEAFRALFEQELEGHELVFGQKADHSADLVILGGGGVMCGQYLKSLEGFEKPKYALGVDVPANGPGLEAIKALNFKEIYCRSAEYTWLLRNELPVRYTPDLAFGFKKTISFVEEDMTLGVILTREMEKDPNAQEHLANALKELTEFKKIKYISMYTGRSTHDTQVNEMVHKRTGLSNAEFSVPKTVEECMSEIAACSCLITMRFHGMIFASTLHVPFVGLAHKGKFSQFCQQERLQDFYIEYPEITPYKILRAVRDRANFAFSAFSNKQSVFKRFEHVRTSWLV